MNAWRPIHVLAAAFWILFSYFSVLVLLDKITLSFGKGLILFAFFLVAGMSSLSAYGRSKSS